MLIYGFLFAASLLFFCFTNKAYADSEKIVINEVMADPSGSDSTYEWLELYNAGSDHVNLNGWTISSGAASRTISEDAIILPNDFLIIAKDKDGFESGWGTGLNVIELNLSLKNSDGNIKISSPDADPYIEGYSWGKTAEDYSLEKIDPKEDDFPDNWHMGLRAGGTPGQENSVTVDNSPESPTLLSPIDEKISAGSPILFSWQTTDADGDAISYYFKLSKNSDFNPILFEKFLDEENIELDLEVGDYCWQIQATDGFLSSQSQIGYFEVTPLAYSDKIILNEILPDPVGSDSGNEFVELYNNSQEQINLVGWLIKDASGNTQTIDGIIEPFEFFVIFTKISINNSNEEIYLCSPDSKVVSQTSYSEQAKEGWSWARAPDGNWVWSNQPTLGALNIISGSDSGEEEDQAENIPVNESPISIDTGEAPNYNNYLVEIAGEVIETRGNTFWVDDGTGEIKVYIQSKTGIQKPRMNKGDIVKIVGIVNNYRGTWRILPQKQDDVIIVEESTKSKKSTTTGVAKAAQKDESKNSLVSANLESDKPAGIIKGASTKISNTLSQVIKLIIGLASIGLIWLIFSGIMSRKVY